MAGHITIPRGKIKSFCGRNHIRELAFFGSVLRDDFGPDSDVDVMVEFEQGCEPDLMEIVALERELAEILEHKVDLVERQSVERSENYIRRRHILQSVERLVHEYFRIIPERVWDVVEKDIPELIRLIEPLVPPDESSKVEK